MFWTVVLDALENTSDGCVPRGETRRRSILPGPPCPAAPLSAARPDPPVVCPGFGLDKCLCVRVCVCVSSTAFRSYAVLSFLSPKSIQKEEHNS